MHSLLFLAQMVTGEPQPPAQNGDVTWIPEPVKAAERERKDKEAQTEEVAVHARPPARSASDWEVDRKTLRAAPHADGAAILETVPGFFVGDRGLPGRAPRLSLRGFDGAAGQDVALFVNEVPLNQLSNVRSPGYADTRFLMPEVIRDIRVENGPYDPRQGDFAVAGSAHMDLGMAEPGFLAKGTLGSFGSRRLFLAFAPEDRHWRDTFAAFESTGTDGPGGSRSGERTSFVGQLAGSERQVQWRSLAALGSSRFAFPGYLDRSYVDRGGYPYATTPENASGRDGASFGIVAADVIWEMGDGTFSLSTFVTETTLNVRQNLTGYALDVAAGLPPTTPDDGEQKNDATSYGLGASYRHGVSLVSKRDVLEIGAFARRESTAQTDTRLLADGTAAGKTVDATIAATNVAAWADASLYPFKRVVVRGGLRLDSLAFDVADRLSSQGVDRTSQGFHVGEKAVVDYAAGGGVHVVGAYGEGFRSPNARDLREGDRVPFAVVRSTELGLRAKQREWQASLAAFQSWLDQDRVFDATARANTAAPSSMRTGGTAILAAAHGPILQSFSATAVRAVFTGTDARFREGDRVPYAPAFTVRSDTGLRVRAGTVMNDKVVARVGVGLEGAAAVALPDGTTGRNAFFLDALAGVAWREFDLQVAGTNLLDARYFDAQYVYSTNIAKASALPPPTTHVLVAAPTGVYATLTVHIDTRSKDQIERERQHGLDEEYY